MDRRRSALALGAAAVALSNAIVAFATPTSIVWPVVVGIAAMGGMASLALALLPSALEWSGTRRAWAFLTAVLWAIAAVIAFPITFAYVAAPPLPGMPSSQDDPARLVVVVASALGPILLLIAAALPSRRRVPEHEIDGVRRANV